MCSLSRQLPARSDRTASGAMQISVTARWAGDLWAGWDDPEVWEHAEWVIPGRYCVQQRYWPAQPSLRSPCRTDLRRSGAAAVIDSSGASGG
jgi:hypothetical protein